ncbi:MAG: helix-turn-helix transcriptional regulator [Clostridia bacterium]|nr:helix-turn-helix transcriptional regulator [Clostridia bacterium]
MEHQRLESNINISEILRVWHHIAPKWERPHFTKRHCQGLLLFLSGHIECNFESFKLDIRSGDIVKLPKSLPYSGKKLSDEPVSCIIIDFETFEENELENLDIPFIYSDKKNKTITAKFFDMLKKYESEIDSRQLTMKAGLYELFAIISREAESKCKKGDSDILNYIKENLGSKELNCKSICEHFFISESTLLRSVLASTGLTPKEYICTERMRLAKKLLIFCRNKKVYEIANECGFVSQYYFSNCFKNHVKMSPSQYREHNPNSSAI